LPFRSISFRHHLCVQLTIRTLAVMTIDYHRVVELTRKEKRQQQRQSTMQLHNSTAPSVGVYVRFLIESLSLWLRSRVQRDDAGVQRRGEKNPQ
jgi:hypothetical protein